MDGFTWWRVCKTITHHPDEKKSLLVSTPWITLVMGGSIFSAFLIYGSWVLQKIPISIQILKQFPMHLMRASLCGNIFLQSTFCAHKADMWLKWLFKSLPHLGQNDLEYRSQFYAQSYFLSSRKEEEKRTFKIFFKKCVLFWWIKPDFAIKVWVSKVRGNNVRQSNLYYYITFGAKKVRLL